MEPETVSLMIAADGWVSYRPMPDSESTFSCPLCGQQFPWRPEYVGRKLACACGNTIDVREPPEPEPDTYDLRDEDPPEAVTVAPLEDPPPGQLHLDASGREIAIPAPPKVLSYRRVGSAEVLKGADDSRSRRRDVWIPLALIAISTFILIALVMYEVQTSTAPAAAIVGRLGLRVVWDLAMTLIAGLVIHWLIDTGLGDSTTALIKLTAIALIRFSLSAAIAYNQMLLLSLLGLIVTFPVLIFLFGYLFEFDFTESLFCSVLTTFMRVISYFGLWSVF